jgi:hypothetical protein
MKAKHFAALPVATSNGPSERKPQNVGISTPNSKLDAERGIIPSHIKELAFIFLE